jgi:geranylgeranyl pyrophosphate synthase
MARGKGDGAGAGAGWRAHKLYLAAVAVLLVVIVVLWGRLARAQRQAREVEARFGLDVRWPAAVPRAAPLRRAAPAELLRAKTFDESRAEVDALVERALELGEFGRKGSRLAEACAQALRGGKRLRAVAVMEIARMASARAAQADPPNASLVDPAEAALAVECLHAASLVIDDLPVFDDDAERRGKPALHAAFGSAVAHMAALSLVAAAFQDVARQVDWIRENCPDFPAADRLGLRLCHDVSRAIGALGAAGGQCMDSALTPEELFAAHGEGAVLEIMRLKTATFFEVAFVTGWLIAGGAAERAEELQQAGRDFGTAFQIADDLGDMAQDAARRAAGKPGWNYANVHGANAAAKAIAEGLAACRTRLEGLGLFTPLWEDIYARVWRMAEPPAEPPAAPATPAAPAAPAALASAPVPVPVPEYLQTTAF